MAVKIGTLRVELTATADQFARDLRRSENQLQRTARSFRQIGMALTAAVTLPIVGVGVAAVKAASEAEGMRSKFNAVFKDLSDEVRSWAKVTADSVGRSSLKFEKYLASVQDTFVPMGFARDQAAELSKSLVQLGVDVASFNVKADDEVLRNFTSALVGNHEAVRSYGIQITQATLNQELMNQGIAGGVAAASEQQKVLGRMALLFQQTTDAQGNAAATAEEFANRVKALNDTFFDVKEAIGAVFLPSLGNLVSLLNETLQAFLRLDKSTQRMIVAFGALAAAAGPVLLIGTKLFTIFGSLSLKLSTFVGALTGGSGLISALGSVSPLMVGIATILTGPGGWVIGLVAVTAALAGVVALFVDWSVVASQVQSLLANTGALISGLSAGPLKSLVGLMRELLQVLGILMTLGIGQFFERMNRGVLLVNAGLSKLGLVSTEIPSKLGGMASAHGEVGKATTQAADAMANWQEMVSGLMKTVDAGVPKTDKLKKSMDRLRESMHDGVITARFMVSELSDLGRVLDLLWPKVDVIDKLRQEIDQARAAHEKWDTLVDLSIPKVSELSDGIQDFEKKMSGLGKETKKNAKTSSEWSQAWATAVGNVVSDFTRGITNMIFEGKQFSLNLKNIFKELASALIRIMLTKLFNPLLRMFDGFLNRLFGMGGAAAGGGAAGGGAGGLLGKLGGLFTNPWTIGIGAAIAGGFGLYKLFKKDPFKSGSKEIARDFGVSIPKGVVEQFAGSLGLGKDFDRKSLFSSPLFLQNVLGPAAEQSGQTQQLISAFGRLEAFGKTFDFSAAVTEALAGNFEQFNQQFRNVFGPALGSLTDQLMGTSAMVHTQTTTTEAATQTTATETRTLTSTLATLTGTIQSLIDSINSLITSGISTTTAVTADSVASVNQQGSGASMVMVDMGSGVKKGTSIEVPVKFSLASMMDILETGQGGLRERMAQMVAATSNG